MKWGRQNSVTPLEHLFGPGADTADALRGLNDYDLYRYVAGWKEGAAQYIAGMAEIRRRESKESKVAVVISLLSLIVAVIALFK